MHGLHTSLSTSRHHDHYRIRVKERSVNHHKHNVGPRVSVYKQMMVQPFNVAAGMGLRYQRQTARTTHTRHSPATKDGECVCDSLATEYVGIFRENKRKRTKKAQQNATTFVLNVTNTSYYTSIIDHHLTYVG